MIELLIEKVEEEDDYTEVELRNSAMNVKLRFSRGTQDLKAAFQDTVVVGGSSSSEATEYMERAYEAFAYFLFTGPLAEIPEPAQRQLLEFAHITAEGSPVSNSLTIASSSSTTTGSAFPLRPVSQPAAS